MIPNTTCCIFLYITCKPANPHFVGQFNEESLSITFLIHPIGCLVYLERKVNPYAAGGYNLANTKWCKIPEKWLKPWHMGPHLRVLSESYLMNTNMTGFRFRWFSKILCSCALDKSSLNIGRVNVGAILDVQTLLLRNLVKQGKA